jgi:small subunit ribosomal protein S9
MEKATVKKTTKPAARVHRSKPVQETQKELKNYYEAVGRRKTAIARVRFSPKGDGGFSVNEKTLEQYFLDFDLQRIIKEILTKAEISDKFSISARVRGGGIHAQAEAIRHGIARTLVMFDAELRKKLKKSGFLTRDPRMRERKKFGLKRARRAPQWSKR